jgi:hypothetical protein
VGHSSVAGSRPIDVRLPLQNERIEKGKKQSMNSKWERAKDGLEEKGEINEGTAEATINTLNKGRIGAQFKVSKHCENRYLRK